MAYSKSLVTAQNILLCQLCETDPKIQWKCIECQLLMCTKCRDRIHPKFKNFEEHDVLELKNILPDREKVGQKLDFTRIRCKQHQGQVCCLFCSTCDKLVCPSCVSQSHTGHKFTEINQAFDSKIQHFQKCKGKLNKNIDYLTKGVQKLSELKTTEESKCQEVVKKIQEQRDFLKQEIDRTVERLIKEVEQKLIEIQDSITGEKVKVEKTIKNLEDQIKLSESITDNSDVSKFFDEANQISMMLEDVLVPPVHLSHGSSPQFVAGHIKSTMVGVLQDEVEDIQMTIDKVFQSEMRNIHNISVCSDNSLWLGDNRSKIIQKFELDGSSLQLRYGSHSF